MSIQLLKSPQLYTPSGNPINFVVSSTASNVNGFMAYVLNTSNNLIASKNLVLRPDFIGPTNSIAVGDFQTILDSVVKYDIDNNNTLSTGFNRPVIDYKVVFVEKIFGTGSFAGQLVDGASYSTGVFNTWDASLDRVSFNSFTYSNYYVDSISGSKKFLTSKPDNSEVNPESTEYLYFLQNGIPGLKMRVDIYNSNGSIISGLSYSIPNLSTYKMHRLNVSPRVITSNGGSLTNASYYKVYLSGTSSVYSEVRTYKYNSGANCNVYPVNILFVNNYGGIDSYQFVNTTPTKNINKTTIRKNTWLPEVTGYTDIVNKVFNPSEEIVSVDYTFSYSVYSRFLTDYESRWLTQLFNSKQVYVEFPDNRVLPVMVEDSSYQLMYANNNKDRFPYITFRFKTSEGIAPI